MKLFSVFLFLIFLWGCEQMPEIPDFPEKHLFTPDLVNKVCAEYELVDKINITFRPVRELPLVAGGPCDHMRGYERHDFKDVQNWVRDTIKAVNP